MPEPGSDRDRRLRLITGLLVVPFGTIALLAIGYEAVNAARRLDLCTLLASLVAAAWFGFITWSAANYACTGYYPRLFIRLWNTTWGWLGGRMPLPPRTRE